LNILESLEGTKVDIEKYGTEPEKNENWDHEGDQDERDYFMKARHFRVTGQELKLVSIITIMLPQCCSPIRSPICHLKQIIPALLI